MSIQDCLRISNLAKVTQMTRTQQAELINIIQFSDLTESEIETLREFIEEAESEAYDAGRSDGSFETSFSLLA